MSGAQKKTPPPWPIISISFAETGDVVADPGGVADPVQVAPFPGETTHDAALAACSAAARLLGVTRCRVRGASEDGELLLMVVDLYDNTLDALDAPTEAPATGLGGDEPRPSVLTRARLFATSPRGRVVAIVGTFVLSAASVGAVFLVQGAQTEAPVVEAAPELPPEAQLPVSAPAGWDTFADWAVAAENVTAEPVLTDEGVIVAVDGTDVIGLDSRTGEKLWTARTPERITDLELGESGNRPVAFASHERTGVSTIALDGSSVDTAALDAVDSIALGDSPFASVMGQAGAILVDGAWEPRTVPATGEPVGTLGTSLVVVSADREQLWLIDSDAAELPDPVDLDAPDGAEELTAVLALHDGRLVTAWRGDGQDGVVSIDALSPSGQTTPVGTASSSASAAAGGTVSYDRANELLAVGPLMVDLRTGESVTSPSGAVTVSAGYGWSTGSASDRIRLATDGGVEDLASDAAVPALILPNGNALVVEDFGATGTAYYSLTEQKETPRGDD